MNERIALPIDAVLPEVVAALERQPNLVIRAPTGAGKTTRVPPALLNAAGADSRRIILLEPRRLAARAAARRMAAERGTPLGDEVGYHVRFERCFGPRTRILVVTPGLFLRMLHASPFLEDVGTVICDEFHERGLENDLALGMSRLLQQTVRPDLKIVVMSATLDVETVATYLRGCPVVASEGRMYPVEVIYQPRPEHQPWPIAVGGAARSLLDRIAGDILVFLPGLREIRQCQRQLEALATERDLMVLPLHGELPAEQQDAALLKQPRRKIVLATNVAETSVTVEGVTAVVDAGLARIQVFDPAVGLDRLKLVPISRASAEQRAGRAGRTAPGICVRLWTSSAHRARPEQTEPEIRRVDLSGAVLQLLALGEKDVRQFPWLDQPNEGSIERALTLLRELGAVNEGGVTALGRRLARLPVHPRLGRLLIEGQRLGHPERVALAAALLAERDPFARDERTTQPRGRTTSDVLERVEALEAFESRRATHSTVGSLNANAARFVLRAQDQLVHELGSERDPAPLSPLGRGVGGEGRTDADEAVLRSLLAAFPDRVARRRQAGGRTGVMVGGRGVRLAPSSGVLDAEMFVCVDVDAGEGEALVRQASGVEREWLPKHLLTTTVEVEFDEAAERVVARRRVRFVDLLLEEANAELPNDEAVARVLQKTARERLNDVLPDERSSAARFLLRARWLRNVLPELNLPPFDAAWLRELLPELCLGRRSFAELRSAPWLDAIHGRLTYQQLQAIEREAPERLEVPSGSRIQLQYEEGKPPVLAARIQELFGLTATPRLAAGRAPVVLHLLAPNGRPEQITDDVASFWAKIYPQIRKGLRARYPKHAWPEDPLTAKAERGPRRRAARG